MDGTIQSAPPAEEAIGRTRGLSEINVGDVERILSLAAGGVLAVNCLLKRTFPALAGGYAGAYLIYRGLTGHCPAYAALGVNTARRGGWKPVADRGFRIEKTIVLDRPVAEVYRFWRHLANLPRFMSHLESVTVETSGRSKWTARGPLGMKVEWRAQMINEKENELIAWESIPGSQVDHAGSVRFREVPGGAGTEVKVNLKYNPPAGSAGRIAAKILGEDPERQIDEDLRHFKHILESGEASSNW